MLHLRTSREPTLEPVEKQHVRWCGCKKKARVTIVVYPLICTNDRLNADGAMVIHMCVQPTLKGCCSAYTPFIGISSAAFSAQQQQPTFVTHTIESGFGTSQGEKCLLE